MSLASNGLDMWSNREDNKNQLGSTPKIDLSGIFPLMDLSAESKRSEIVWPNEAKCAVSFAYIGGLQEHVDMAPPLLAQLGFRASFFVDPDVVLEDAALWKSLKGSKHEFGCSPFESQTFDGNLYGWTSAALIDELNLCKDFVRDFFEVEPKGLAHRSSQLTIDGKSASLISQNLFRYVVTGSEGSNHQQSSVKSLSVTPVISYSSNWLADLEKSDELKWIIIPFRRMFTESNSTILLHRLILENINRKRNKLWVAPVGEVASELNLLHSSTN